MLASTLPNLFSAAALGGNGTVGGAATVTGILSPGNGNIDTLHTGSLTWNGAATAGPDTNWIFDLGAANASDLLAINGDFIMGTGSVFHFDFNNMQRGTFTLVTWTGSRIGFADDASAFSTTFGGEFAGSAFSFVGNSLVFSAVPEASTWVAMVALTVSAVAISPSRQRRKKIHEFGAAPCFLGVK